MQKFSILHLQSPPANCKPLGPPSMYGRLEDHSARASLDFSCPPNMHNIIEISKLRKNNEKWGYVSNYVIFYLGFDFS